jgi:hypothetical protein
MPGYPSRVHVGTADNASVFELRPDFHSMKHAAGTDTKKAVAVMPDDTDGVFAIYKGAADRDAAGPVYSAGRGGSLAVPTGRVLVRLREGLEADTRRKQFKEAGYDIERTLSYAPNAAWLRPASGGVADALSGVSALKAIPDVVHVEPQMLQERRLKQKE